MWLRILSKVEVIYNNKFKMADSRWWMISVPVLVIIAIAENYLYVLANFLIISDSQLTS